MPVRRIHIKVNGLNADIGIPLDIWRSIPVAMRGSAMAELTARIKPFFICYSATPAEFRNPPWSVPGMWEQTLRTWTQVIMRRWAHDISKNAAMGARIKKPRSRTRVCTT